MKLTITHILELISELSTNKEFNYVSGGESKVKYIRISKESQSAELSKISYLKQKVDKEEKTNITQDILNKICSNIESNSPFKIDSILEGSGNKRSVYEAILAHTREFYVCMIEKSKHLIWDPENPHESNHMCLYISDYIEKSLEARKDEFFLFLQSTIKEDEIKKYEKYLNGAYRKNFGFFFNQIKVITGNDISELWSITYLDHILDLISSLEGPLCQQNKRIQNGLALNIANKYKDFLVGRFKYRGTISTSVTKQVSEQCIRTTNTLKYRPYITAIKSKPFLLLAGISGTGKSRIVRELARACWDETSDEYKAHKPRNFEMIQVKPNWHDSSELIGYVSRVSGNPIYVAGDFLKFVARAWGEPEVPYFLCLDEMNLAPVEQYFAEYLSVIESRKVTSQGEVTADPILKKSEEDWYRTLTNELTVDDELRNRFLTDGISLPQNLIVVGTVNMDETTFSFSRKVLDRAMTIEMNEVDLEGGLTERYEQIGKLSSNELIGTAVEGVDVYSNNKAVCDIVIGYLKKVNSKLEGTPFKIAYRTRNEFLLYVVNNLPYKKNSDGEDLSDEYVIARALDEITSMKILSRIEGDETKVSRDFIGNLKNTIKEGLKEISGSEYSDKNEDGNILSVSLSKLNEMEARLESGYTSFWS